jgi:hypothetical protein
LTCLTMSWESPFTRSYQTPNDKVVLNPKSRASYSAMLLVALKSRCTMYLIWSPCGVRSTPPARAPYLREEPSKKRVQWGPVKTGALGSGSGEDRSSGLWLTVIQHLTLDCMAWYEIQLKLSQLRYPFSNIASHVRVVEDGPQPV